MFFYKDTIPKKGTIVVSNIMKEGENDSCFYVTLPEYKDCRGIVLKKDLPKRLTAQKKEMNKLRQLGQIICTVIETPDMLANNELDLVELSIKGVDKTHHKNIINRFINIDKIHKLIKYVSLKFELDINSLTKKLHSKVIMPLTEANIDIDVDDIASINDYSEIYHNYLRQRHTLIDTFGLDQKERIEIDSHIGTLITETKGTSTIDFDLFVWKCGENCKDAVSVIRNVFEHIKNTFVQHSVSIRYCGAPRYQIYLPHADLKEVDSICVAINKEINEYMVRANVIGFECKIDKKEDTQGDVFITFPFKFDYATNELPKSVETPTTSKNLS